MDNKLNISIYFNLKLGLKDLGLDSEVKEILKDIIKLRDKRLAKPNYIFYIKKL